MTDKAEGVGELRRCTHGKTGYCEQCEAMHKAGRCEHEMKWTESCGQCGRVSDDDGLFPCNVEACPNYGDESDTSYCKIYGFTGVSKCSLFIAWNTRPMPQPEGAVEALLTLASNWQREHDVLNGPGDHRHDRIAGRVYGDCAQQLRAVIAKMKGK